MLKLENLKISYSTTEGTIKAVDGVSVELTRGDNLGLIGESGCGKSTIVKSLFGLLERNGRIDGGAIYFENLDLTQIDPRELKRLLWDRISLIPQASMNSLNPVYKISSQIMEAIELHRKDARREKARYRLKMKEYFALMGLDSDRIDQYPHQFSGGMAQRATIALAMILDPVLIVADEPTTALDVIMQDQILKNFLDMREKFNSSLLLVTHDISIVSEICDYVTVMYAGKFVEYGTRRMIFKEPLHPYTMGLINAFPKIETSKKRLVSIPGIPPNLMLTLSGCRFKERCPFRLEVCEREPALEERAVIGHLVACHRAIEAQNLRPLSEDPATWGMKKL